jgi:hypothetical protein
MEKYILSKTNGKGEGLFASQNIQKGEVLFTVDLSKQPSYLPEKIAVMPNNDHADYVGRGRFVISVHPYSYMNHSCNPNFVRKYETIARSVFTALRDIIKGEELTYDYGVGALEQFGNAQWVLDCQCGSENCRKKVSGDFFEQPQEIQKKYYQYLPPSLKRKYKERFLRENNGSEK